MSDSKPLSDEYLEELRRGRRSAISIELLNEIERLKRRVKELESILFDGAERLKEGK